MSPGAETLDRWTNVPPSSPEVPVPAAWLPRIALLTLIAVAPAPAGSAQGAASAPYHVSRRITLGGEGGWDYLTVDTARARLFITRSDRVMVVDQASGKMLGEIPGLDRGHGVALDYSTNHGFATSGADGTVVMFDLATLAVLKRLPAAIDADAVLYDPSSKHVFSFNGDANSATVLDAATGDRVGTIALGGKPEFGVTDRAGRVYVNIEDRAEVVEIDAAKLTVRRRWSIAPCEDPTGLALDAAHGRLFSVCGNALLAVSDIARGAVVATQPIGRGVDGAGFDAATGDVFASAGEGKLTVVHEDGPNRYHVVTKVATMPGARTMTIDPKSHRVYTVSARFGPQPSGAQSAGLRRRPPLVAGSFTLLEVLR
jgi:DNA-binding beta-propeller fold protein YncE